MRNPELIALDNASKTYQMGESSLAALHDTTLGICEGEFVAIVGASGSGKSTLLNLVSGIDKPTRGRVIVAGTVISTMSEDELARWRGQWVGIVFQFFQLLPTLTAIENVLLPMHFQSAPNLDRRARAEQLLTQVGMLGRAGHLPSELSGGEQQRVAIARALANDPPLLLADEPTGNLDTTTSTQIADLLRQIHRAGKTIVMVTHEESLAAISTRILYLQDGHIVPPPMQSSATRRGPT